MKQKKETLSMSKEAQLLRRHIEALKSQRTLDHNEDLEREINHLEIKLIQVKTQTKRN
jgi:hypothetical protein